MKPTQFLREYFSDLVKLNGFLKSKINLNIITVLNKYINESQIHKFYLTKLKKIYKIHETLNVDVIVKLRHFKI